MIALFLAALLAADDPMQFDLHCNIQRHAEDLVARRSKDKPIELNLRVDLRNMAVCEGDCRSVSAIYSVDEAEISFSHEKSPLLVNESFVDRRTGAYFHSTRLGGRVYVTDTGTCLPRPFSGIPDKAF